MPCSQTDEDKEVIHIGGRCREGPGRHHTPRGSQRPSVSLGLVGAAGGGAPVLWYNRGRGSWEPEVPLRFRWRPEGQSVGLVGGRAGGNGSKDRKVQGEGNMSEIPLVGQRYKQKLEVLNLCLENLMLALDEGRGAPGVAIHSAPPTPQHTLGSFSAIFLNLAKSIWKLIFEN